MAANIFCQCKLMSAQPAEGYKVHITAQSCFETCSMDKTLNKTILSFFKVLLNHALQSFYNELFLNTPFVILC